MIIKGLESEPFEVFEEIARQNNGSWNGIELKVDQENYFHVISLKYFDDIFINVIDMKCKESIRYINTNSNKNRITCRMAISGIQSEFGNTNTISDNDIIVYNSLQNFELVIPKNKNLKWITFSLPYDKIKYLTGDENTDISFLGKEDQAWFHYINIPFRIYDAIETIFKVKDNFKKRRAIFYSKVIEIFMSITLAIQEREITASDYTGKEIEQFMKIKDEIKSDYLNIPSIEELANKYGISKSNLQKKFTMIFNMPIKRFINNSRMEEARRLLSYTNNNISEIAYILGYSHIHHFSNAFKKHYGLSPKQLRE
ncbi:MAG: AraC family transcriptional regulator [Bacteroidales bacterium]|nr:AraC family transcriptional regulator [Bacteroidales bacterium]